MEDFEEDKDENVFVKQGKLVLFVDSNAYERDQSKQTVESMKDFSGCAKFVENSDQTLRFLSKIRSVDGRQQLPDLIFISYSFSQSDGLQLMDQIFNFCSAWSPIKTPLKPRIIICSTFSL